VGIRATRALFGSSKKPTDWPCSTTGRRPLPCTSTPEARFEEAGDRRNALAARLGYIWVTADSGVVPEIAEEVAAYLEDPSIQAEPRLLLRALIAKAMLDRDANELAARESWERILSLAEDLGDRSWEDRAKAELGQILYMDGDLRAASDMFREAITSQYVRLDLGAAMYYTAMVGNGFASAGRPESALQYLNATLRVAGQMIEDRPISPEERVMLGIVRKHSGGNPYRTVYLSELSREELACLPFSGQ